MSSLEAIPPSPLTPMLWHLLSPGEVATHLSVDPDAGLTSEEAARRIVQYG
ncbi:MAG: hypothetical protein K8R65_14150, partial [Nitrospirae bacterium]|nr:hypothetical protein [Nitrospirota bacterium]